MNVKHATALVLEAEDSSFIGCLRTWDEAQVYTIRLASKVFSSDLPIISLVNCAARGHAVSGHIAAKCSDRVWVNIAGKDMCSIAQHKKGQREVSNASKEICNDVTRAVNRGPSEALLLCAVALAKHDFCRSRSQDRWGIYTRFKFQV